MSKTIDERVVSIQFDNAQFERKTAQTMSTLDKLKQKLNFRNAGKGLEYLGAAANKVNMNGLSKSIDVVQAKFSAMDVVAMTALSNITNRAIATGERMIKALTLDPITTGFQEYETQMGAIQTILANTKSKGSTLEDVNSALDELNTYADKTIYNFTQMTKNIGTFTAAGVDLDKSVSSIKGIANLAAVSGSTSQQASTAMYQLSQALAAGRVSLMDWNSVVNAGMGGELFQEALKRTSRNLGTGVDAAIEKYGNFRESLTKGQWLTTEVLTETLSQLSGAYNEAELIEQGYTEKQAKDIVDLANTAVAAATEVKTFTQLWDTLKEAAQSGWSQTWRIVVGDFEEAKEMLTGISNVVGGLIGSFSDRRNNILEGALSSKWTTFTKVINEAGVSTEQFQKVLQKVSLTHDESVEDMIKSEGSLKKVIDKGMISKEILTETLERITGTSKETAKSTEEMSKKLKYFQDVVDDVWRGDYGNIDTGRIERLEKAGYNFAEVQALVNKTVDGHKLTLEDLTDVQAKAIGFTDDQIIALDALKKSAEESEVSLDTLIKQMTRPTGRELILEAIANFGSPLVALFKAIGAAWNDAFPPDGGELLYSIISGINKLSQVFKVGDTTAENLTRTMKGLFAILDLITMVVGGGLKIAFKVANEVIIGFMKALGFTNAGILEFTAMVGDAIVAFRDWIEQNTIISDVIAFVIPLLFDFGKALWNLVQSAWELPMVQGAVNTFVNAFKSLGELINNTFGPAITHVQNFVKTLGNMKNVSLDDVVKAFNDLSKNLSGLIDFEGFFKAGKNIIDGLVNGIGAGIDVVIKAIKNVADKLLTKFCEILGIHSPSLVFYEFGKNIIEGLVNGIVGALKIIVDGIKGLGSTIVETFKSIDFQGILTYLADFGEKMLGLFFTMIPVGVALYLAKKLEDIIGVFYKGVSSLAELGEKLSDTLKVFQGTLKAYGTKIKAEALKSVAIAIAILAGSVIALTFVDPKKLYGAIGALTVLAGVLVLVSFAISKMEKSEVSFAKVGAMLASLGITILLMASAVKKLGSLNPEQAKQGFLGLAGVVGAIGLVLLAFSKMDWKQSKSLNGLGSMMLKMSVSLLLMATVVKMVGKLDSNSLVQGTKFMAVFAGFIFTLTAIGKYAGNRAFDQIGKMMLKISSAMLLMLLVVNLSNTISAEEALKGAAFAGAFVIFVGALVAVTKIAKDQQIAKLGGLLVSIAGSMLILSLVVKLLGSMNFGTIVKGSAGVLALTGIMYLLLQMVKSVGNQAPKIALTLLAMSTAIGILAGISLLMGFVETKHLIKGVAAVSALGLVMAAMIHGLKGAKKVKAELIVMTVAIGLMAAAIAGLSFLDPAKVAVGTAAISALMGMFALMMHSTKGIGKKALTPLLSMTVVVGALAGIIALLSLLKVDSVIASATSISVLMLTMAGTLKILSTMGSMAMKALIPMAAMEVIMLGLVGIIALMNLMDPQSVMTSVSALTTMLLEMTAVLAVLTIIGLGGPAAFYGLGALGTLIVGLAVLIPTLGGIFGNIKGMEGALDKGLEILAKLGEGLGNFFGGIIKGFSETVMSALPNIGKSLSEFMTSVQPFINGAKKIDSSSMDGVKSLAEAIMYLTGANLLDTITSWLPGASTFEELGKNLIQFGTAMVDFSNIVSGNVNSEAVNAAANAGKMMTELQASLPGTGGVVQWFMGEKDLAGFGSQLIAFGTAITTFSNNLVSNGGVNVDAVTSASNAGKVMMELQSTLPNTGGLVQWFSGEKDLAGFGTQLIAFGGAITGFSNTLVQNGGINAESITAAANAGMVMTKLQETLPNTGGVVQWFMGQKDLANFGAQLKSFGDSIVDFLNAVSGNINPESVTAAANAGQIMINLQNSLPEKGWFSSRDSLGDFGRELATFGVQLANYADNISNVNVYQLNGSIKAVNEMTNLLKNMTGIDSNNAKQFADAINSLARTNVSGFMEAFNVSSVDLSSTASVIVDSLISGINSKSALLTSNISTLIENVLIIIKNKYPHFSAAGIEIVDNIIKGISKNQSKLNAESTTMLKQVLQTIKVYQVDFYLAGRHLVQGFANGIYANTWLAEARSREMARAAKRAAQQELDEHSPSKEGYKIGDYFGIAFVNGIGDNIKSAFNISRDMAKNAKNGLSDAISRISDTINSDMDTQPTIRPVLDLSGVAAGANAVNGLFDMSPSVGLMANVNAVSAMRSSKRQNGTTDDVISALKDLKRSIGDSNGNSYTINGVTYDDGSNVASAVKDLIRAAKIERRV